MEHLVTPLPNCEAGHVVHQARFLTHNEQSDAARERLQRAAELAPLDGRRLTVLVDTTNECNLRCKMC